MSPAAGIIAALRRAARAVLGLPSLALIAAVRAYQIVLSPILGRHCRFEPTCSHYFIQAVKKYGAFRGGLKGIWRVCRCNPWCQGGDDPP